MQPPFTEKRWELLGQLWLKINATSYAVYNMQGIWHRNNLGRQNLVFSASIAKMCSMRVRTYIPLVLTKAADHFLQPISY